ncbi:hypothetical protein [Paracidovorax sp. MALMAid1276]|uniref:tetratricopeptide repeat protein n=1 Tax=Paracidovorax sp. MALMAid1276 TaxID=3411631 RepID=UPI003B9D3DDA
MVNLKLGLSALLLEVGAWSGPALLQGRSDVALAAYLVVHAGASVLLALALLPLTVSTRARPRWAVLTLAAAFSFTVPVAGFLGILLAVVVLYVYRAPTRPEDFGSLQLPEFDLHQRMQGSFRQAGLRSFLGNPQAPAQARMSAMVALQFVSGRVASPLLRTVLSDPSEDLRLLAYGMLDTLEKRVNRAIDTELAALQAAQAAEGTDTPGPLSLEASQRLSDLYWELVYQQLVQGDLRQHAIGESLRYCDDVLRQRPQHPQLTLRRGRLLHEQGDLEGATRAYEDARSLGLPATRVLPYQAEAAFEQNDFDRARELLHELGQWDALPRLRPVIDYWSRLR